MLQSAPVTTTMTVMKIMTALIPEPKGMSPIIINILSMKLPEPLHLLTASLSPIPATSAPYSRLVNDYSGYWFA